MHQARLLRLQAELEYGVPIHGDSIPVTLANSRDVPTLTVARHAHGYVLLFRADMPPDERARYRSVGAAKLFRPHDDDLAMLSLNNGVPVDCCWYVINRIPDPSEFPDVEIRDTQYIVERNGQIAAQAWSALHDARAAEVELMTAEAFRRLGLGRQVVAAWAHDVRREGRVAFYSHLVSNVASRALAASVGAWKYAETREYV